MIEPHVLIRKIPSKWRPLIGVLATSHDKVEAGLRWIQNEHHSQYGENGNWKDLLEALLHGEPKEKDGCLVFVPLISLLPVYIQLAVLNVILHQKHHIKSYDVDGFAAQLLPHYQQQNQKSCCDVLYHLSSTTDEYHWSDKELMLKVCDSINKQTSRGRKRKHSRDESCDSEKCIIIIDNDSNNMETTITNQSSREMIKKSMQSKSLAHAGDETSKSEPDPANAQTSPKPTSTNKIASNGNTDKIYNDLQSMLSAEDMQDIKNSAECLREAWHANTESTDIFREIIDKYSEQQVLQLYKTLQFTTFSQDALDCACKQFIALESTLTQTQITEFAIQALQPQLLNIDGALRRQIAHHTATFCKTFPTIAMQHLCLPCLTSSTLDFTKCSSLLEIVQTSLKVEQQQHMFSAFLLRPCLWTDGHIHYVHTCITQELMTTADGWKHCLVLLEQNSVSHTKNLKMGKLLLTVIKHCADVTEMSRAEVTQLEQIINMHGTFMKKSCLNALKKIDR